MTLRRRDVVTWLGVGAIAAPSLAAAASAEPAAAATQAPGEPLPFRSLEPGFFLSRFS